MQHGYQPVGDVIVFQHKQCLHLGVAVLFHDEYRVVTMQEVHHFPGERKSPDPEIFAWMPCSSNRSRASITAPSELP